MSCGKAEDLAAAFEALVLQIGLLGICEQEEAISKWLDSVPLECLRYASRLVLISHARHGLRFNTGALTQYFLLDGAQMSQDNSRYIDQSTRVTAKGDVNAVAGAGARIEHSVIQTIKDGVKQSGNIDQAGADLFRQLLDEVAQCTDGDVQREAIEEIKKLRAELEKSTPKESLVQKSFNALKTFVAVLPTITKVGEWMAGKFGWVFV